MTLEPTDNPILKPTAGGSPRGKGKRKDLRRTLLDDDRRYLRKPKKRDYLSAIRAKRAADHIRELPPEGYTLHAITRGNYNGWDVIPATLAIIEPQTIAHLTITTLGYARRNAFELCQLIDAGKIGAADFICSHFHESRAPELCLETAAELNRRPPSRFLVMRNHTKLQLIETTDGRRIVVEGSANMQSCNNLEQFNIHNDAELYDFHKDWLRQVFDHADLTADHVARLPQAISDRPELWLDNGEEEGDK